MKDPYADSYIQFTGDNWRDVVLWLLHWNGDRPRNAEIIKEMVPSDYIVMDSCITKAKPTFKIIKASALAGMRADLIQKIQWGMDAFTEESRKSPHISKKYPA